MQLVARNNLHAFLTGTTMDPDKNNQEEFNAIANAVLAHAPATITHFMYTDHENGDDPVIQYSEYAQTRGESLIREQYTLNGDSYYGLFAQRLDLGIPNDDRILYHCYLGGSPLNSAPGFVLTALAE